MQETTLDRNLKYRWQQTVLDALIVYPPTGDKINAAEEAISARLCQRPLDNEETLALHNALVALRIVFPEIRLEDSTEMGVQKVSHSHSTN